MKSLALVALLAVAGCAGVRPVEASSSITSSLQEDDARPAHAQGWVRSELYFGVGGEATRAGDPRVGPAADARWLAFIEKEVASRFPDGLTVFDAHGYWRLRDATAPNRVRTKVLVILHEDTPRRRSDIEDIRLAWKRATGDQSVLWSRHPVDVSF